MNRKTSFEDFLKTGALGRFRIGSSMRELGENCGPPDTWEAKWNAEVPTVWVYKDVEFIFERENNEFKIRSISIKSFRSDGNKFKAKKFIKTAENNILPGMTLKEFENFIDINNIEYENYESEYFDEEEEKIININGRSHALFWKEDSGREFKLIRIGAPPMQ